MKLFTTKQIAEIDQFTIENEPISDIDLMERASMQITNWLVQHFSTENRMLFFVGPGNNGGDALAIARQMTDFDFQCEVFLMDIGKEMKGSPKTNWQRLEEQGRVRLSKIARISDFPETGPSDVFIDGLFGSGLTRPLEKLPAKIVQTINELSNTVVAIDIPSGLMGEDNSENNFENIIKADFTLTFQFPKISFLFAEHEQFTGKWEVLPIGLHPEGIERTPSDIVYVEKADVEKMLPARSEFSHKGTFGHALLIAGSYGKMGATVLASKGCLRAGTGLLTTHVPRLGYSIIQTAVPEAMVSIDPHDSMFTEFPDLLPFSAIGIGPGIGMKHNSKRALHELIEKAEVPMVLDADALNILSEDKEWLKKLPANSILTPHPGEFRRLAGDSENSWEQLEKQKKLASENNVIVLLKGAFSAVATPDGKLYFNSTGNPGMATAGSGDTLTGIILGLLAQKLPPANAVVLAVYLHGRAGDLAAEKISEPALIAGDISDFLGEAFLEIE
jgi:NAD(P)H-hydrate epimerase